MRGPDPLLTTFWGVGGMVAPWQNTHTTSKRLDLPPIGGVGAWWHPDKIRRKVESQNPAIKALLLLPRTPRTHLRRFHKQWRFPVVSTYLIYRFSSIFGLFFVPLDIDSLSERIFVCFQLGLLFVCFLAYAELSLWSFVTAGWCSDCGCSLLSFNQHTNLCTYIKFLH